MSKTYRDKQKNKGMQARHKGRNVHQLDDILPLDELIAEISNNQD